MRRGDVVEVDFYFPTQNRREKHMVVVLSVSSVFELEETFVCVPISDSEEFDNEFSFPIDSSNFENGHIWRGWVRTHLISTLHVSEITNNRGTRMKSDCLARLFNQITCDVFGLIDTQKK